MWRLSSAMPCHAAATTTQWIRCRKRQKDMLNGCCFLCAEQRAMAKLLTNSYNDKIIWWTHWEKIVNVKLKSRQFFRKYHCNIVLASYWRCVRGWCGEVDEGNLFLQHFSDKIFMFWLATATKTRLFYSLWQRLMNEFANLLHHKFVQRNLVRANWNR